MKDGTATEAITLMIVETKSNSTAVKPWREEEDLTKLKSRAVIVIERSLIGKCAATRPGLTYKALTALCGKPFVKRNRIKE